jgi:hypothetical protein
MKRFLSAALLLVALLSVSCNFTTPQVEENLGTIGIKVGGAGSKSGVFNLAAVEAVEVRIFYSDGTLVNGGDLTLIRKDNGTPTNLDDDYWNVSFSYDPNEISGNVILHAMAFDTVAVDGNGTGEILFQGTTALQNISSVGESVTIPTERGYQVGDRGPGGGWVIYDSESFYDKTYLFAGTYSISTEGKSWRYFEIGAKDLEENWISDNGLGDNYEISSGKVVANASNTEYDQGTIVLDTTDFYWGESGDFNTFQTIPMGNINTNILDTMSSATPDISKTVPGRSISGSIDGLNLVRRDTADIVRKKIINNYEDWFIPSKNEFERVYNDIGNHPLSGFNLTDDVYWTSSEDEDLQPLTTNDPDITVPSDIEGDAYWAFSIDVSAGTAAASSSLTERYRAYKVRPFRVF